MSGKMKTPKIGSACWTRNYAVDCNQGGKKNMDELLLRGGADRNIMVVSLELRCVFPRERERLRGRDEGVG